MEPPPLLAGVRAEPEWWRAPHRVQMSTTRALPALRQVLHDKIDETARNVVRLLVRPGEQEGIRVAANSAPRTRNGAVSPPDSSGRRRATNDRRRVESILMAAPV